jgi:hypothetical protein
MEKIGEEPLFQNLRDGIDIAILLLKAQVGDSASFLEFFITPSP